MIREAFGIVFRKFSSLIKTFHRAEFPKMLFPYLKLNDVVCRLHVAGSIFVTKRVTSKLIYYEQQKLNPKTIGQLMFPRSFWYLSCVATMIKDKTNED